MDEAGPSGLSKLGVCCVYSGASTGERPDYMDAAKALGAEIARRGMGFVYGGGSLGLMGAASAEAAAGGSAVVGVIPELLAPKDVSGLGCGETVVVPDMHTRKAEMARRSDCFVALPGGFGTLEELLEVVAWQQLGYHAKPVGVLNVAGFFDPLLAFLDHATAEGFIRPAARAIVVAAATPAELFDKLESYEAPESIPSLARRGAFADAAAAPAESTEAKNWCDESGSSCMTNLSAGVQ